MYRQFRLQKTLNILRSLEAFLFQMNRDNNRNSIDLIWVGKCHLSLSDCRKEEIIRLMTLINGFAARGYSIPDIHLSNSPFNVIVY